MFTSKTTDFLFENRLKDSKIWFEEHKPEYQKYVLTPFIEFVKELTPTILSIDDKINCEPKVNKAISRIYRDTRFSKDKSVFRDVMWCVFMRDKKLYNGLPGYFFELSPRGFRYGCGYYTAGSDSMESIRNLILSNDKDFKKALKTFETQDVFNLEGDCYKKSKFLEQENNLKNWLDRKSICFIHNSIDFELLFSDKLVGKVAQDFKSLEPVYNFLLKAESRKND